jgi:mono/diheme cytochrome c family protein
MSTRSSLSLLVVLMAAGVIPAAAQSTSGAAPNPAKTPPAADPGSAGYSADLVGKGDSIFHGSGNCYACHGSKGEGLVGPNLTDAEWIHSKGSYDEIIAQIQHGVPKAESKSGIEMQPKGGAALSDDDVKAVAAYVYSLSHK